MPFSCWTELMPAPSAPFGPVGPRAPAGPASPAGPADPAGPIAPAGPVAPRAPVDPASPFAPAGPAGPAGPAVPAAPAGPAGPAGPVGPALPAGPCGPVGPFTFHEMERSLWRHVPDGPASRSLPFPWFAHALIAVCGVSCREAAVATSAPPAIVTTAAAAASSRTRRRLKLVLTPTPSVAGRLQGYRPRPGSERVRAPSVAVSALVGCEAPYGRETVSVNAPVPRRSVTRRR